MSQDTGNRSKVSISDRNPSTPETLVPGDPRTPAGGAQAVVAAWCARGLRPPTQKQVDWLQRSRLAAYTIGGPRVLADADRQAEALVTAWQRSNGTTSRLWFAVNRVYDRHANRAIDQD